MAASTELSSDQTETTGEVLGDEEFVVFVVVTHVFLCGLVGLLGIMSNAINVVIFIKQGFNNTINISLLGLAVSDICCLTTTQWLNLCVNPLFQNSGVPLRTTEVLYLTAGWPQKCFARITNLITVYITAERCICILFPLKVKTLVTPTKTTIIICSIYTAMILILVPEYTTSYIDWKFYPDINKTILGLSFTNDRHKVEGLAFGIQAIIGVFSFLALIGFTLTLVWKLRRITKWRRSVTGTVQDSMSSRDSKTSGMIVLIASILIICYTPGIILFATCFLVPQFSILGTQSNLFLAMFSLAFISESVNSSVNIILYYKMSSKFRQMFQVTFYKCFKPESVSTSNRTLHE